MYNAYVTTLKNVRKHPNADRLLLADCFGNTVCVSLDYKEGQTVIYFPVDGQLSEQFAHINHLCRKTKDGQPDTGYLDPDKRNIRAIKLRGEKSDGLAMPLSCLSSFGDISTLKVGDIINVFNGHEICKKYIPHTNKVNSAPSGGNHTRKHTVPIAPLFAEHADTEQLAYNLNAFKSGDQIEITLKMHGTSGRTGYLPKFVGYTSKNPFFRNILKLDYKKLGKAAKKIYDTAMRFADPIYDWGYVTGTRRVTLDDFEDGGFYGSNAFREPHAKFFEGKLWKGETVYYEIVGYVDENTPIMPSVSNKPTNDKNFIKQYGDTTVFSYGCESGQSDFYVYRMTMTNEDGAVVEYTPDFMRYRCEQMGAKCVPVFWKGYIPESFYQIVDSTGTLVTPGEYVKDIAEKYYDGPDPVGKTHVREGVVVRIVNRPKFCAYKHKNFSFKCLSGIATELITEDNVINEMDEDRLTEL